MGDCQGRVLDMIEFTVTTQQALAALSKIKDEFVPAFKYALAHEMAFRALAVMQPLTPIDTGHLRSSEAVDEIPEGFWIGTHSVDYAYWVAFGSSPHDIYPVNKKALAWKGGAHPVTHVHHPGSKGNPFHTLAFEQVMKEAPTMALALVALHGERFGVASQ